MTIPNQSQCKGCKARFIVDGTDPDLTVETDIAPNSDGKCHEVAQNCIQDTPCNLSGNVTVTVNPASQQLFWLDGNLILFGTATKDVGPLSLECGSPEQLVATVSNILGPVISIYAKCDACVRS